MLSNAARSDGRRWNAVPTGICKRLQDGGLPCRHDIKPTSEPSRTLRISRTSKTDKTLKTPRTPRTSKTGKTLKTLRTSKTDKTLKTPRTSQDLQDQDSRPSPQISHDCAARPPCAVLGGLGVPGVLARLRPRSGSRLPGPRPAHFSPVPLLSAAPSAWRRVAAAKMGKSLRCAYLPKRVG